MRTTLAISKPMLSLLCQALVGGTSFIASLALLHFGRHRDYTAYVLIVNCYMLLASILNALLLQPLVTLSSRMSAAAVRQALGAGSALSLLLGVIGAAGLLLYSLTLVGENRPEVSLTLCALFFCLVLFRDVQRTGRLLYGDLASLLKLDGSYCLAACLVMLVESRFAPVDIRVILYALSLPAFGGLVFKLRTDQTDEQPAISHAGREFWRETWACARWALPGVLVAWLFNSAYWFLLNSTQGSLAVATLAAARLAFTPIGLAVQGWAGYFRPLFSRLEYAGRHEEKRQMMRNQDKICVAAVLSYTLLLALLGLWAPGFLPGYLRGGNWQAYIWSWGGYFSILWVRMIRMTSCLADSSGFRIAFHAGLIGCVLFYLLLAPAAWLFHRPIICPLILILCEFVVYFALGKQSRPPLNAQVEPSP